VKGGIPQQAKNKRIIPGDRPGRPCFATGGPSKQASLPDYWPDSETCHNAPRIHYEEKNIVAACIPGKPVKSLAG